MYLRFWDLATGVADYVQGEAHKNQVMYMDCKHDTIVTCGMDDTVRFISASEKKYRFFLSILRF